MVGRIFEDELVRNAANVLTTLYREHPRQQVRVDDPIEVIDCDLEIATDDSGDVTLVSGEPIPEYLIPQKDEKVRSNELLFRFSRSQIEETIKNWAGFESFLFLQPTFQLEINGFFHHIRPDFVWFDKNVWHLGEIKVYLDRDGETSGIQVASTVKQAAVGILAMRQTFDAYGCNFSEMGISEEVDIVFRKHGSLKASVTRLNAKAELEALSQGIQQAHEVVKDLSSLYSSLDEASIVESIPNHYTSTCAIKCPYHEVCNKQKTVEADRILHHHPGVLSGEHVGVSGQRALMLAQGAETSDKQEAVVARWLQAGWEQKI
jgi:hypothetical protein